MEADKAFSWPRARTALLAGPSNIRRQELLTSASQQHTTSLTPERAEKARKRERQTSNTDILHKVGMTAYTCSHSTWRLRQKEVEFQDSLSSMVRPCLK